MYYYDETRYKRPDTPPHVPPKKTTPDKDVILLHIIQTARDMDRFGMGHLSIPYIQEYTDRVWPEIYVEGWFTAPTK